MPDHLGGDSLEGEGLEEDQQRQLRYFLTKWQHVFSTHDEDYGCTGVVKLPGTVSPCTIDLLYQGPHPVERNVGGRHHPAEQQSLGGSNCSGTEEDGCLEVLCGLPEIQAAWYSTLHLASCYWQVQVEERDR